MVTAIIVNYFSSALAVRAALSVLADQPDAQVIIVDNSADEKEFATLKDALSDSVACYNTGENLGFGRACNLAFAYAQYEWILLLNPDAYVLDGCIDTLVEFMHDHPRAGAVAPLVFWDQERSWLLPPAQLLTPAMQLRGTLASFSRKLSRFQSIRFRNKVVNMFRTDRADVQEMLSGGHMLLRKSAIVAAGGLFDKNIFMFYEDTDLCMRLCNKGYRLYLLPKALAVHEWCCNQTKNRLSEESRTYYLQKHFSNSRLPAWSNKLGAWLPAQPKNYLNLGTLDCPPLLKASTGIQDYWLLELSPVENFIPALYHFGQGEKVALTDELWQRLGSGEYFLRLGAVNGENLQSFRLRIEKAQ